MYLQFVPLRISFNSNFQVNIMHHVFSQLRVYIHRQLMVLEFTLHGFESDEVVLLLKLSQTSIAYFLGSNPSNQMPDHELDLHQFLDNILRSLFVILVLSFLLLEQQICLRLEEFLTNSLFKFVTNFGFQTILCHQMHSKIMPVAGCVILLTWVSIVEEISVDVSGEPRLNLPNDFDQFLNALEVALILVFTPFSDFIWPHHLFIRDFDNIIPFDLIWVVDFEFFKIYFTIHFHLLSHLDMVIVGLIKLNLESVAFLTVDKNELTEAVMLRLIRTLVNLEQWLLIAILHKSLSTLFIKGLIVILLNRYF